ncbi:methyltransferase [Coccidioides immitis RS]|uniref:Methyltransferase n=1 Tax=Coccidioides immitis (strain RS) TaxID=246410 RepID=A0A0D8JUJ5_COCIM|nr:methyltransferase [Coccidioides immitis RS]KJF60967.1 methyltransferase [Coccidioides immitis RS]
MATDHTCSMIEPDSSASGDTEHQTVESDYASIASTIPNYVYQNGRRYHSHRMDQYLLPNDEREQERLDFIHHIFRLTLGGELCYAKLDNPQRILDIGTGTGIWAMEVGETFPSAEVIGTDLSPTQSSWAPPNVQFLVDDALQDWVFPESSFDFIHIRTLGGNIPDWLSFMQKCYKYLKPGGQIEISECRPRFCCDDNSYPQECRTRHWMNEFERVTAQTGLEFDPFPQCAGRLQQAGFQDVEAVERVVPIGTWPKDKALKTRGRYFMAQLLGNALETYTLSLFTRTAGWTPDEVYTLLNGVTEEVSRNKMHLYTHFGFTVGRKPWN